MAKILVIDDMDGVRRAISSVLRREGHYVDEASNGQEGQNAIERDKYDLIITDMFMPEKDGFDVMLHVQAKDNHLPVIVISGGGAALTADWALTGAEAFASATLKKPFKTEELLDVVNKCLSGKKD